MTPSQGYLNPTWIKCLTIDDGKTTVTFVTFDAIGADGNICDESALKANVLGYPFPRENIIFGASHTHSGPGAVSPEFLWEVAPATDLIVPELFANFTATVAQCIYQSWASAGPVVGGSAVGTLTGVTVNRRAPNPWVTASTIDPHLAVMRIDTLEGEPLAVLWNYAMHGTCYGPGNLFISSDIAGAACDQIESELGGVALFFNGDAGDIDPSSATCACSGVTCEFEGKYAIASAVSETYKSIDVSNSLTIGLASSLVSFGPTQLNITLQRWDNCTQGGELDLCSICAVLDCDANVHLDGAWVENVPRFTAVTLTWDGKTTAMVTVPGEALVELGWIIRNISLSLGFDDLFLLGYSQNHMGYFATPNEYDWGGYESQLTFWGIETASMVASGCKAVLSQLANAVFQ